MLISVSPDERMTGGPMMKNRKAIALVSVGLVAGLALGSVGIASAATTEPTGSTVAACGYRIGQSIRDAGGRLVDVLAKMTDQTTAEIAAERADGKSIADIADENGVKSSAVVDEALKARTTLLEQAVKDGTMTQDAADAALTQMTTRLEERVTSDQTGRPDWAGGGRGAGAGNGTCGGICDGTGSI